MTATKALIEMFPSITFAGKNPITVALAKACAEYGFSPDDTEENTITVGGYDFTMEVYGDLNFAYGEAPIFKASYTTYAPRQTISTAYFSSVKEALEELGHKISISQSRAQIAAEERKQSKRAKRPK